MTMKAARFYAAKDIRVEEIAEPQPGPAQVKLKIAWCGICGSDLHEYLVGPMSCPQTPHPNTREQIPITLGHELSGTIVSLGKDVDSAKYPVGQNVVVEPLLGCKASDCPACKSGNPNICEKMAVLGCQGHGGMATWLAVDAALVHIIPDNIPLDIAACIEPLAVAWHAVKRSGFQPGHRCLIIGSGPIGLFVLKVLKSLGCTWLAVSEPAKARRDKSIELDVDLALDPLSCDVVSEVKKHNTQNGGVDIAFECSGVQAGLAAAIASVKPRGTIMNIALWEQRPKVDMMNVLLKEKVLTGSCCYAGIHQEVIDAVATGKIKGIQDLITKKIPIDKVVEDGFEALVNDKGTQIKILVSPS